MCIIYKSNSTPSTPASWASSISTRAAHLPPRMPPVNSMNILILGYQEWSALNNGIASRKFQKAVDLQNSGKEVKIVSEDEFYSMLEKIPV